MCSTDNPFQYQAASDCYTLARPVSDREIVEEAKRIIANRFKRGEAIVTPSASCGFLIPHLSELEYEVFACIFLDNRHRLIEFEILFRGTIDGASVHPREIVKQALKLNAAAVIVAHNHPSGVAEPSRADKSVTRRVIEALALVDVRVLDHIIVAGGMATSLAERGLI